MKLTVTKFTMLSFFFLGSILMSALFYNYSSQQEKTAVVIFKTLQSNMAETSYLIAKNVSSLDQVGSIRPLLDRIVANNEFVKTILLVKGETIHISTDPFCMKVPESISKNGVPANIYETITNATSLATKVKFYEGATQHVVQLLYVLDHENISLYFSEKMSSYFLYFTVIPVLLIGIIISILRMFILKPLEDLHRFAYFPENAPKKFLLSELEVIRSSMQQTFLRIEKEKDELYKISMTDTLSGVANRNALKEKLENVIAESKRNQKEFAFLFLDLDNFKAINDSLGHNVGDILLQNIASALQHVIRPSDFIARVGGDEFIILITNYSSNIQLVHVTERILKQLQEPIKAREHVLSVSGSIGIALYPQNGEDMISLMKNSDIAMYDAKKKGHAQYSFFTDEINNDLQNLIALEKEMKQALQENQYKIVYQPKIDIHSSQIVGLEALIRWEHPEKGDIGPHIFIPIAEENNFINPLGEWIIQECMKDKAALKTKGVNLPISINISAKQIHQKEFIAHIARLLRQYDLEAEDMDVELTEHMFLQDNEHNFEVLRQLKDMGIKISLDDFGTGYSSLSYLKMFPIDFLKIDKSFVDDFDTEQGAVFLNTIVNMGQNLNMKIVAEGVESQEQVEFLKTIGCDQYQGYYFSKPLPLEELEALYFQ